MKSTLFILIVSTLASLNIASQHNKLPIQPVKKKLVSCQPVMRYLWMN